MLASLNATQLKPTSAVAGRMKGVSEERGCKRGKLNRSTVSFIPPTFRVDERDKLSRGRHKKYPYRGLTRRVRHQRSRNHQPSGRLYGRFHSRSGKLSQPFTESTRKFTDPRDFVIDKRSEKDARARDASRELVTAVFDFADIPSVDIRRKPTANHPTNFAAKTYPRSLRRSHTPRISPRFRRA